MKNDPIAWRAELGRQIAGAFATDDKLAVAAMGGLLPFRPFGQTHRLSDVFQIRPMKAVAELQHLFEETLGLIETTMPRIDTMAARQWIRYRRAVWDHPPRLD